MSGASTLSKKDLFRLHLREVEYDFNNLVDILDSVFEGREEFLAQMSEENAKLRNLVEALLQCAGETKRDKGCDACPMWAAIYEDDCLRYSNCMLRPTLRELGIEA